MVSNCNFWKKKKSIQHLDVMYCPTPRAADTASPWARRGGWSGEVALPAVVVGRLRRAADAIVGHIVRKVMARNKRKHVSNNLPWWCKTKKVRRFGMVHFSSEISLHFRAP